MPRRSLDATRDIFRAAALFTFLTVAMGSMVAATDSSSACPAWPLCYADRVGPALQGGWLENPAIEFVHRVISGLCLILLGVAGWRGRRHRDVRLRVFPWIALAFAVGAAVFGMMTVLFTLPLPLALVDVGGALVALLLITLGARALDDRPAAPSTHLTGRLAGAAFGVLVLVHLLGIVVAGRTTDGTSSFTRVIGWPVWQIVPIDGPVALQVARMVLVVVALVLIVGVALTGLRTPHLTIPSLALVTVTTLELCLGLLIGARGLGAGQTNGIGPGLAVLYAVTAVGILWALSHLASDAFPARESTDADHRALAPSR